MDGATNGSVQGSQQGFVGGPGGVGGFPGGGPPPGVRGGGALMFLGPWGGIVALGVLVVTYIVFAIAVWQFLKKAGLTPAIALLMLIPVVNLGVALWAAFTEWPVLKEMQRLKTIAASADLAQSAHATTGASDASGVAPAT